MCRLLSVMPITSCPAQRRTHSTSLVADARAGVDTWTAGAAEHADLLHCLPGNVLLASCALGWAARSLADLSQPFPAAGVRRAPARRGRVVIPLLKRLDREGVIRRLEVSGGA